MLFFYMTLSQAFIQEYLYLKMLLEPRTAIVYLPLKLLMEEVVMM